MSPITCLIPVYNEGDRLLETLGKLKNIKLIGQTVCVDDGSTDNGVDTAKQKFPEIKVIKLAKNGGKSEAVRIGLGQIDSEYTLLFDADIRHVVPEEINEGLKKALEKDADMVIFRRMRSPFTAAIFRSDTLLSGERLVRSSFLKKIMNNKPVPKGYEMEAAINGYMYRNKKKVFWYPVSTLNTFKILKMNPIKAVYDDLYTLKIEADFVGWRTHLKIYTTFCRTKLT